MVTFQSLVVIYPITGPCIFAPVALARRACENNLSAALLLSVPVSVLIFHLRISITIHNIPHDAHSQTQSEGVRDGRSGCYNKDLTNLDGLIDAIIRPSIAKIYGTCFTSLRIDRRLPSFLRRKSEYLQDNIAIAAEDNDNIWVRSWL